MALYESRKVPIMAMTLEQMQELLAKLESENATLREKVSARAERSAVKPVVRLSHKRESDEPTGEVQIYGTGANFSPETWEVIFANQAAVKELCAQVVASRSAASQA